MKMSHEERFLLVVHMIKNGKTANEIIKLFRHVEDFDEKMARFHIQQLKRRHKKGQL